MPTARSGLRVAVVDDKIYAIGGWNEGFLSTNEMYDPETNTWTTKQPIPTARYNFAIAVYQNRIYVFGGHGNVGGHDNIIGSTEVYYPLTDTWDTLEPMPTFRAELDANTVGDKIYLIDGDAWPFGQNAGGLNEVYDPSTDSWSTKSPMPTTITHSSSAVVDNKIYIIDDGFSETPTHTQIYDPIADSWSYAKKLPTATYVAAAGATTGVLASKRIYIIGGEVLFGDNVASYLNQIYDPVTDTWTYGIPMSTPRWSFDVAVMNDELYAIGGKNGETNLAANERYTPHGYVPEFTSWTIILLFLIATFSVIVIRKKLANISCSFSEAIFS
jgi:N-acetylneuraminic acid mutarotase